MIDRTLKCAGPAAVGLALVGLGLASGSGPDDPPPRPRPGLTAQQSKEAVKLAQGAMVELRKKTDGARRPGPTCASMSWGSSCSLAARD